MVVIPFGVPAEGRGLGLGLAALVHTFVHVDGVRVPLVQLHSRPAAGDEGGGEAARAPVEAFVPPDAWRDISGRGDAPGAVGVVLTGSFEPPIDGAGTLQLLAFDVEDGQTRARVDASLDGGDAGATLVSCLEQLGSRLGGEIGALQDLRELGWDALESVLRAERCVLHDPTRGGPHDRVAAMLHLGRAIGDAPKARYPAVRLAALALDIAEGGPCDPRVAAAAVRALEGAAADAPGNVELLEALAAVHLCLRRPRDAERRMNEAISIAPGRVRPYTLLARSLRAQRLLPAALEAIAAGFERNPGDPSLLAERGIVERAAGDPVAAVASWRAALARDPVHPQAFGLLAAYLMHRRETVGTEGLVDTALAAPRVTAEVLRCAVQVALATEADGLPRAARVARLCERVLTVAPDDGHASVALARAEILLGDKEKARGRLARVLAVSPGSSAAAEAQVFQLALQDPAAEAELQSVVRAAHTAPAVHLADVAARGRRLATLHGAWPGWLAAAVAERRRARWVAARGALEVALEIAPGAAPIRAELARVLIDLDDAAGALEHASRATILEPGSPRMWTVLGLAYGASGRRAEAAEAFEAALTLRPDDREARDGLASLAQPPRVEDDVWARGARRVREAWRRIVRA
jgi:tetratricopeptide (TPR) repeat protein